MTITYKANDPETQIRQVVNRWGAGNNVYAEHFYWRYPDTKTKEVDHDWSDAQLRGHLMVGLHNYLSILHNHNLIRIISDDTINDPTVKPGGGRRSVEPQGWSGASGAQ